MNPAIIFIVGYLVGNEMAKRKPAQKKPSSISECAGILPNLQRETSNWPVESQDISMYRNIIENPYNYPGY